MARPVVQVLAQELIKEGIVPLLLQHFRVMPFEARKDTVRVFSDLAYHNWGGACLHACVGGTDTDRRRPGFEPGT
jgi:hypothetical protein